MHRKAPAVSALLVLLVCLGTAGCSLSRKEPAVSVAAAADLKFALDEIVAAFHQQHPDLEVRVTYGASGNFYAQLSNRAPFDVFFSADMDYPRRLIEQGLASPDSAFV